MGSVGGEFTCRTENVPHEALALLYDRTIGWLEMHGASVVDADNRTRARTYPIVGQVLHDMLPDAAATFAVGDELLLTSGSSIDSQPNNVYGSEPFCCFVVTPNATMSRKVALYLEPEYDEARMPVGFRTSRGQDDPIGHVFAGDTPETVMSQIDYFKATLMRKQLSPAECTALQTIIDHLPIIDQAQTRAAENLLHDMPHNATVLRDTLPDADPDLGATTEPRTFKISSAALASCSQFAEWALGDGGEAEVAHIPAVVMPGVPGSVGLSRLVFSFSSPTQWRNIELTFCEGDVMVHDERADADGQIDVALHAMTAHADVDDIALSGVEDSTISAGYLSASEIFQLDELLTRTLSSQLPQQ